MEEPDSDTTVILDKDTKPTVPTKRKTKGCNKKSKEKTKQKKIVTKTYILRKGGSNVKPKKKKRKPYLFKCLMCALRWSTCKERNDHFKQNIANFSVRNVRSSSKPPVPSPCIGTSTMTDSSNAMFAKHFFPLKVN